MKVPGHVNEAKLCEDICHKLSPRAPDGFKFNVKFIKGNGVKSLEAVKVLLKVLEVIGHQGGGGGKL